MISLHKKYSHSISIAIVVLLTVMIEYILFGKIFLHPNEYCFVLNPDGTQIYFDYAYYVKFGNGTLLTNQNYPFYELIFMTDAQASMSLLFSFINHHIFPIENYSIGIFNGMLLYSIPLCSYFLFKIFRHININYFFSILFALFVCFLSPQLVRMTAGHYGLGYVFFFPALIYLMFKLTDAQNNSLKYVAGIMLLLLFFGLNNGHMSLAGCLQVFVFGGVWLLINKKQKGLTKYLPVLTAIFSFVMLFLIIRGLDFVHDREKFPWGFLIFHAQFESIFLPSSGILYDFINNLTPIIHVNGEGEAYVGIIGFFFLGFSLYRLVIFIKRKKLNRILFPLLNKKVNVLLLAGISILMYAMAIPFRWGLQFVLGYIPFLNQFRCPGRFSWIFFYAFSIYMVYYLYIIFRRVHAKQKYFSYIIIVVVVMFYSLDIYSLSKHNFKYDEGKNYAANPFIKQQALLFFLKSNGIDTSHYQAVYGLPLCNAWSGKFGKDIDPNALVRRMAAISYCSGIPWINAKLSRISVSQILESAQLVSNQLIEKEILHKISLHKNILFIHQRDYALLEPEKFMLEKSSKIAEDELYSYYCFDPSTYLYSFRDSLLRNFTVLMQQRFEMTERLKQDGMIVEKYFSTPRKNVITDKEEDKIIFEGKFRKASMHQRMEFSIWTKADYKTDGSPWVLFSSADSTGSLVDEQSYCSAHATDYQNGFLRVNFVFEIKDTNHIITIKLRSGKNHLFERMVIKPEGCDLFDSIQQVKYYNNYILESQPN